MHREFFMLARTARAAAVIGLAALGACDSQRGGPNAPSSSRVRTGIRVEGPASIPPGGSAQYRAIESFSDGTTADATSRVGWSSSSSRVLSVTPQGVATALSRGEAQIRVSGSAGLRVFVLEPGTYRINGIVMISGVPVTGARVSVAAGTGAGLSAVTEAAGTYALYGVGGEVELDVTADGFQRLTQAAVVNAHATVDFSLRPAADDAPLAGEWQLTFLASPACGTGLPDGVTVRTYGAAVTQAGALVTLYLSFAMFDSPVRLGGRVVEKHLEFALSLETYYSMPWYVLLEVLDQGRFLGLAGFAAGEFGDSGARRIEGTFNGEFALYAGSGLYWSSQLQASCHRDDHRFRLDRR
jgi:hypothetical protein